jgi:hypothetical protein
VGQGVGEVLGGGINKVVGVVVAGGGVGDPASVFDHLVENAWGEAIGAFEDHVFEEMRHARPGFGDRPCLHPGIDHHRRTHNLLMNHGQPIRQLAAVRPQSFNIGKFGS